MATTLKMTYDAEGDILYLDNCPTYADQKSDSVGDEMVGRFNPTTGEIETVEILFFLTRLKRGEVVELPAGIRLAGTQAEVDAARPQPRVTRTRAHVTT